MEPEVCTLYPGSPYPENRTELTQSLEHISVPVPESLVTPESEVAQLCPTLCNSMDCSLPGFSIHGILQASEYWSGLPFPSPGDLPDLGIEPGSPALQALGASELFHGVCKTLFLPLISHKASHNEDHTCTCTMTSKCVALL